MLNPDHIKLYIVLLGLQISQNELGYGNKTYSEKCPPGKISLDRETNQ